jgi:hypothetical protein
LSRRRSGVRARRHVSEATLTLALRNLRRFVGPGVARQPGFIVSWEIVAAPRPVAEREAQPATRRGRARSSIGSRTPPLQGREEGSTPSRAAVLKECSIQGVGKPGNPPVWGTGDRRFKSGRPDSTRESFCQDVGKPDRIRLRWEQEIAGRIRPSRPASWR